MSILQESSLLNKQGSLLCSTCQAIFQIHSDGVVDFRVLSPVRNTLFAKYWKHGQEEYENGARECPTDAEYYRKQIRDSEREYRDFCDLSSIKGVLLDIGGSDGRLRHFCPSDSELSYVSLDPYLTVRKDLMSVGKLAAYPVLDTPCDFICGMAEHLPFINNCVDFIRMNSVLDRLWDAHMGMREMMRVLKPGAEVFLGLYLAPEKTRLESQVQRLKDFTKILLRREDHHVWHPTLDELYSLIDTVGFERVKENVFAEGSKFLLKKPLSVLSDYSS